MHILKIHYDPPSLKYGTGNFIKKFSENLIKLNFKVTNFCCHKYDYENFKNSNIILCNSKPKKRYPFFSFFFEFIIIELRSAIFFIKNHKKIDLIISYGDCGILVSIMASLLKKPKIKYFFVLYKDLRKLKIKEFRENKLKFKKKKFHLLINFLIKIEDVLRIFIESFFIKFERNFITASKLTKKRIINGDPKKNVLINYYYHDLNNLGKTTNVNQHNDKINILLIGNDIYLKGIIKFLKVLALEKNFFENKCKISIVGISNISEFKFFIKKYNLENLINAYPHTDQIDNYFKNINIFVNLSLIEGWNISIVDSYLKGIKILSTKVGCVNEIFLKDNNVEKCSKNNIIDIKDKLKKIISEKSHFNFTDYEIVKQKLNHDDINQKYLDFLDKFKK